MFFEKGERAKQEDEHLGDGGDQRHHHVTMYNAIVSLMRKQSVAFYILT